MAFNAKNLHYEKQEPAFLRRLKGAHDASDGRHNVQVARPKKARLKTGDDDEDDPVIVDESGEVIGKTEFEGMQKMEPSAQFEKADAVASSGDDSIAQVQTDAREVQQVADVGGPKKRKQARVIGIEESDDDTMLNITSSSKEKKDSKLAVATETAGKKPRTVTGSNKSTKRMKKIKLSFDDPE